MTSLDFSSAYSIALGLEFSGVFRVAAHDFHVAVGVRTLTDAHVSFSLCGIALNRVISIMNGGMTAFWKTRWLPASRVKVSATQWGEVKS